MESILRGFIRSRKQLISFCYSNSFQIHKIFYFCIKFDVRKVKSVKLRGKHIEFLFLFLAGIMLCAHTIVPHHHHNRQVCIEKMVGQHHGLNPDHPFESDHPHDDQNHRYCILNQLIVVPNNQWKQDYSYTASCDKNVHGFVVFFSANTPDAIFSFNSQRVPEQKDTHNPLLLLRSLRFRAPPAV